MPQSQKQRSCSPFRTYLRYLSCILVSTSILVLGLALAIYFLFPRQPQLTIYDIDMMKCIRTMQIKNSNITFGCDVDFQVGSENYIDYYVSELLVRAQLISKSTEFGNAFGKLTYFNIPSHSAVNLTIPVMFDIILGNQSLAVVQGNAFEFLYRVDLKLPLLSWTGYSPSFSGYKNMSIPTMHNGTSNLITNNFPNK